ncbi:MAG: SAM-dependent methyltransferase [Thermoanaerobaculia bacterium]
MVGVGIAGPAHVTREALAAIRAASTRLVLVADFLTLEWLEQLVPGFENLADAYAVGKSRDLTYAEMTERVLAPVRRGRKVAAIFYGHPGVFARSPHEAVRRARAEGYEARMYPAVSALDCLFADVGVDPGEVGCQEYEATDFLLRRRRFDPCSALVLWQIGVVGVFDYREEELWSREGLGILAEVLLETYPAEHEVVVYEASTLPLTPPVILRLPLGALGTADVTAISTLYVPPLPDRATDRRMLRRLGFR